MSGSNLKHNMSYKYKGLCNLHNAASKLLRSIVTAKVVPSFQNSFKHIFSGLRFAAKSKSRHLFM